MGLYLMVKIWLRRMSNGQNLAQTHGPISNGQNPTETLLSCANCRPLRVIQRRLKNKCKKKKKKKKEKNILRIFMYKKIR